MTDKDRFDRLEKHCGITPPAPEPAVEPEGMMAYRIPTDLPLVKATSQDWPDVARIIAAQRARPAASVTAKLASVTITLNEQPGKVYAGNCCGIMCQGVLNPWGWKGVEWSPRPIGYALIHEGATGKDAPFLAFAKVEDSLGFLIDRVIARSMYGPDSYALSWVGANLSTKTYADAVRGFELNYDKAVSALWQMVRAGA